MLHKTAHIEQNETSWLIEKGSSQQGFCKIRAIKYRLKDICNSNRLLYLGRSNKKVTAKQATGILTPVLRKAPNVMRNLDIYCRAISYASTLLTLDTMPSSALHLL